MINRMEFQISREKPVVSCLVNSYFIAPALYPTAVAYKLTFYNYTPLKTSASSKFPILSFSLFHLNEIQLHTTQLITCSVWFTTTAALQQKPNLIPWIFWDTKEVRACCKGTSNLLLLLVKTILK